MTEPQRKTGDRLAFIASGKAEDLPALMSAMEKQNISLVTIHARPLKTELGQYAYLIECSSCSRDQYAKLQENSTFAFRYLGCFDVH
jgi:prephenate dehydratase/chorismate mutase/prephenate dehydratase